MAANNNNNNTPLAPCGYVTVAECEAHREKLREKDTEIERKISEILVSMATTQQQIKLLLKVLSVFSGGILTIATTLIINFII